MDRCLLDHLVEDHCTCWPPIPQSLFNRTSQKRLKTTNNFAIRYFTVHKVSYGVRSAVLRHVMGSSFGTSHSLAVVSVNFLSFVVATFELSPQNVSELGPSDSMLSNKITVTTIKVKSKPYPQKNLTLHGHLKIRYTCQWQTQPLRGQNVTSVANKLRIWYRLNGGQWAEVNIEC